MGTKNERHPGTFGDRLILRTDLLASEAMLSPLEITTASRSGRLVMKGLAEGEAGLLVGGVVVATGAVVTRGGRRYLKIRDVYGKAGEEAGS